MKNSQSVVLEGNLNTSRIELGAISKELNHKYWNHWSDNTQVYTKSRYLTNFVKSYAYGY